MCADDGFLPSFFMPYFRGFWTPFLTTGGVGVISLQLNHSWVRGFYCEMFDISTEMFEILTEIFEISTKMFEFLTIMFEISTEMSEISS